MILETEAMLTVGSLMQDFRADRAVISLNFLCDDGVTPKGLCDKERDGDKGLSVNKTTSLAPCQQLCKAAQQRLSIC